MVLRDVMACALLSTALLLQARPAAAQTATDQLPSLAGSWACRTVEGTTEREQFAVHDGVVDEQQLKNDGTVAWTRTFASAAGGGWTTLVHGMHATGTAGPWTGQQWIVNETMLGRYAATRRAVIYELRGDGELRIVDTAGSGGFPRHADLCARGDAPPSGCPVSFQPPLAVVAALPERPLAVDPAGMTGAVVVRVALDSTGKVTSATVAQSTSPLLNAVAINAARNTRYQPAYRDCNPVAAGTEFRFAAFER